MLNNLLAFSLAIFLLSLSGAVTSVSPPSDEAAKARVSTAPKNKDSERIGHWGSLESPFYKIFERSKKASKKAQMLYLSPSRDEYYMVAAGNSLALNRGIQEEQVVPARYRQEFLTIAWEQPEPICSKDSVIEWTATDTISMNSTSNT
ncbi:hypothetical protein V6N13_053837 [Hibiscus sabdariffa]